MNLPELKPDSFNQPDDLLPLLKWEGKDIRHYWLDQTKPYTPPRYTLSYNGTGFAPLGGIHALTGQAGNGKTMTFTQLMVAILGGKYGGLKYELSDSVPEPSILYVDTEMEEDNTIAVKNRIFSILDWEIGTTCPQLHILRLREEDEAPERWKAVLRAMHEVRPTVCFLDGIIDLVDDFNNIEQCQPLIYQCMKAASFYNLSLWLLIHENPNSTKMVGNLGSIIQRKVTDVFQVVKTRKGDGGAVETSFEVKQLKARSKDVDSWRFHVLPIADWGVPEEIESYQSMSGNNLTSESLLMILRRLYPKISWPAREEKFKSKLAIEGITGDSASQAMAMALNLHYIRYQTPEESANQRRPLLVACNDIIPGHRPDEQNTIDNNSELPF